MGSRSTVYIPALTLPFSSVFFDSFSITLLYSRRRGSWLFSKKISKNWTKIKINRFSSPLLEVVSICIFKTQGFAPLGLTICHCQGYSTVFSEDSIAAQCGLLGLLVFSKYLKLKDFNQTFHPYENWLLYQKFEKIWLPNPQLDCVGRKMLFSISWHNDGP